MRKRYSKKWLIYFAKMLVNVPFFNDPPTGKEMQLRRREAIKLQAIMLGALCESLQLG